MYLKLKWLNVNYVMWLTFPLEKNSLVKSDHDIKWPSYQVKGYQDNSYGFWLDNYEFGCGKTTKEVVQRCKSYKQKTAVGHDSLPVLHEISTSPTIRIVNAPDSKRIGWFFNLAALDETVASLENVQDIVQSKRARFLTFDKMSWSTLVLDFRARAVLALF